MSDIDLKMECCEFDKRMHRQLTAGHPANLLKSW